MKREYQENGGGGGGGGGTPPPPSMMSGKSKMMEEEADAGVDELLAALGYKVRSSDMADVAQKLEQLDMVMGTSAAQDDAVISHLASDTIHYNPSDLSTWLESMLSELNAPVAPLPPPPSPPPSHPNPFDFPLASSPSIFDSPAAAESSTITTDIKPLYGSEPVGAIGSGRDRKRMRTMTTSSSSSSSRGGSGVSPPLPPSTAAAAAGTEVSSLPLVVVDSQEAGIRLVHTLMACAEAVHQENYKAADTLVKQISVLAASQGGAMRKVAGYFAEALARRIYRVRPQQDCSLESAFSDILQMHFYESCPYLKFAHFTANQAILEAFAGCRRVHVIDFGMKQGMQWPALMQALALRPDGPPSFRLTGVGPPQPDNTDALQQVGWKLAQIAETIHVDFEYRGLVASCLADLEPYLLESAPKNSDSPDKIEAVAVNSVFELHRLLARPGAIEKVLDTVKAIKPKIVTVVEQEANHNAGSFAERFTEALHYYSTMFDSLEGGASPDSISGGQQDKVMSEVYLGFQIATRAAVPELDAEALTDDNSGLDRGPLWTSWTRAMNSLHVGDVDSAYAVILSSGDDMLLLRLMEKSGPIMDQLSSEVASEVLHTVGQFLLEQSLFDISLTWIQQLTELIVENGADFLDVPLEVKRGILLSLHDASGNELPEDWEGATVDQILMQLASSWEINIQQLVK